MSVYVFSFQKTPTKRTLVKKFTMIASTNCAGSAIESFLVSSKTLSETRHGNQKRECEMKFSQTTDSWIPQRKNWHVLTSWLALLESPTGRNSTCGIQFLLQENAMGSDHAKLTCKTRSQEHRQNLRASSPQNPVTCTPSFESCLKTHSDGLRRNDRCSPPWRIVAYHPFGMRWLVVRLREEHNGKLLCTRCLCRRKSSSQFFQFARSVTPDMFFCCQFFSWKDVSNTDRLHDRMCCVTCPPALADWVRRCVSHSTGWFLLTVCLIVAPPPPNRKGIKVRTLLYFCVRPFPTLLKRTYPLAHRCVTTSTIHVGSAAKSIDHSAPGRTTESACLVLSPIKHP